MISRIHHFAFSVANLERTIKFYTELLGFEVQSRTRDAGQTLGVALFGNKWGLSQPQADLDVVLLKVADETIEFIEYIDPQAQPYHQNPSIAGSAHLAFDVDDIEAERARLEAAGVEFHSPTEIFKEPGKPDWKWCYFRDPDGICVELVEQPD